MSNIYNELNIKKISVQEDDKYFRIGVEIFDDLTSANTDIIRGCVGCHSAL